MVFNHKNKVINTVFLNSLFKFSSFLSINLNVIIKYMKTKLDRMYLKNKLKFESEEYIEYWGLNIINEIMGLLDCFNICETDNFTLNDILKFLCIE